MHLKATQELILLCLKDKKNIYQKQTDQKETDVLDSFMLHERF